VLPAGSRDPGSASRINARQDLGDQSTLRLCEPVEATHSNQAVTERLAGELRTLPPLRLDSQCKYAVVARGQADAYIRFPTDPTYIENIWDHAAGCIVAEEAGATVTDIRGGALDFSTGIGLENNQGIICAAPYAHEKILAILANVP
jgi:3'(2'), 5'-bisphosphate nucleotidase